MEKDSLRFELFTGESCSGIICFPFAGGTVCLYTAKEPDKASDNEDAAGVLACDKNSGALIVTDGLGGTPGGSRASAITLSDLAQAVNRGCQSGTAMREAILDGIEQANRSILEWGIGAATTLIAAEVNQDQIRTYHVGDSVALVVGQRGKIKHQTIPHSPIGYAVEAGLLHKDDALQHDELNIISNVVGSSEMRVEMGPLLSLASCDTLILGSDGLFDNIRLDEIIGIIRCGPLQRCAEKLVEIVNDRMTHVYENELHKPDDMTFILYRRSK